MEDWDPQEWQGRSREQYESSARILVVCLAIGLVTFVIATLGKII